MEWSAAKEEVHKDDNETGAEQPKADVNTNKVTSI
jgi:hypothetical protein